MTIYMIVEEQRHSHEGRYSSVRHVAERKVLTGRYFTNRDACQKVIDVLNAEVVEAFEDYLTRTAATNADRRVHNETEQRRYEILRDAGEDVDGPRLKPLIDPRSFEDWSHLEYATVYVIESHERDEQDVEARP